MFLSLLLLILSDFYVDSHALYEQRQLYFFLLNLIAFISFSYCTVTYSTTLKKSGEKGSIIFNLYVIFSFLAVLNGKRHYSTPARDWTSVPAVAWHLNYWTTRKTPILLKWRQQWDLPNRILLRLKELVPIKCWEETWNSVSTMEAFVPEVNASGLPLPGWPQIG